jgi:hypothetical protein
MSKQKTIKDLLILLKEEYTRMMESDGNKWGLCYSCHQLYMNRDITGDELMDVEDYLKVNAPNSDYRKTSAYWYRLKSIAPRQRWLNKHIELNS